MKIEILFPDICTLNGDLYNPIYLSECIKGSKLIYTTFDEEPAFINEQIDVIYIGSMTEHNQELVIEKLMPYKDKIENLIDKGTIFLVTGNATNIFGKSIFRKGKEIKGLNIFDFYTVQDFDNRYHELFLGGFEKIDIIGFRSDFGKIYKNKYNFIDVKKGIGNNDKDKNEGVRKNNFFATNILGPFLIQNPLFTKYLINLIDPNIKELKYEAEIMDAYKARLEEYKNLKF